MYNEPVRERYTLPSAAFGASTAIQTFKGPKGKKGIVRDITVNLTADMVGTTTVPEVCVGSASGNVEYARFRLGTSATAGYTTAQNAVRRATTEIGNKGNGGTQVLSDFTGHISLGTDYIPADTNFVITGKAGTGGTPAGTGIIHVDVDWI